MKKRGKIWLLSSSTGGHAIPVLEVYRKIKSDKNFPLIIHSGSKIEKEIFSGASSVIIRSGKINRHQMLTCIGELARVIRAFVRAFCMIVFDRPQVIFSKGGFNAAPFLYWARVFKVPYFLHESDIEMGAANKYFYKQSVKTFVSFPVDSYDLDRAKLAYSGFVVREFGHTEKPKKPVILITGGSQGAVAINDIVFKLLPTLLTKYQVIHHIGLNDEKKAKEVVAGLDDKSLGSYEYFVFSVQKLAEAMAQATLVISRAGSTIAEIAALSKASILIPYPYAASDHQTKNARYLEKHGAAIIIKQEQLTEKILSDRIEFILGDERNIQVLGENIHKSLKTDGAKVISEELLRYIN